MNKTRKSSKTEKKKVYRSGSLNWTGGQTPVVERHLVIILYYIILYYIILYLPPNDKNR